MTPLERKAHLVLQGQSLLDEWEQRCRLFAEGNKLWVKGHKLRVEGRNLRTEGSKLWVKGHTLYVEGSKLRDEGSKIWGDAIAGAGLTMTWSGTTCTLSNGEIYRDTTRT